MPKAIAAREGHPFRVALFSVTLAVTAALVFALLPASFISWDVIQIELVSLSFLIAVFLAFPHTYQFDNSSAACLRPALVIWIFLLISEEIFNRTGGNADSALQEKFSVAAYGELSLWILILFAFLVLSISSPQYLRYLSSSQFKWLSIFGVLCSASTIFSPRPLFSLAWVFKLCLAILVLGLCSSLIRDYRDVLAFVRATFWACSFLIVVPIFRAWVDPSTGYEGGRLGGSPTSLSVFAGIVLVLSLTLGSLGSGILPRIFTMIAPIVMILGGGKAGIIGGVLSATLIYLLKRKVGSAFVMLIAMLGLGFVLVLISSPLNSYFHTYLDSENGENLTGRTSIWETAVPVILQKPVLGHGYMGSRFVSVEIGSKGHDLWEADHMHNAFLDVLYNNGVVGLTLILIMHIITVKNLLRVITCRGAPRQLNEIAVGFLAIYANLLINAFCNAIIGGRPSALFLIFLALFALSGCFQRVLRQTSFSARTAQQELTSRKPQMAPAFGQL